MIDLGWRIDLLGEDNRAQRSVALAPYPVQWDVLELLHIHVFDLLVGVLHRQHVVIAGVWIDPIARRYDTVRCERCDDVVHYILRRKTNQARALTVDVELDARVSKVL